MGKYFAQLGERGNASWSINHDVISFRDYVFFLFFFGGGGGGGGGEGGMGVLRHSAVQTDFQFEISGSLQITIYNISSTMLNLGRDRKTLIWASLKVQTRGRLFEINLYITNTL